LGKELDPIELRKTDHICADCGGAVVYMDEVFLLQIVRSKRGQEGVLHYEVIDEHDPDGCFRFEPYYFCIQCWEKNYGEIHSDMEDELPVNDYDSKFECVCCGSGIREFELAGLATLGEFHISERAPNGMHDASFLGISNPDLICLYCMSLLNDGCIDMWPDLTEYGECVDCIQARCWRASECECRCHFEAPEEDEEQPAEPTTIEYR